MSSKKNEKRTPITRSAYRATRSLLRFFQADTERPSRAKKPRGIKVAFIHNEQKIHSGPHTGAAQINRLMARALDARGVSVRHFYPRIPLMDTPVHLKGLANILFFYSMLEQKERLLGYDIIQGTTYTPLPFLPFDTPVVCHFGSTVRGFLDSVPQTSHLTETEQAVYRELYELRILPELDLKTRRPLEDIADIEQIAASRATMNIATSQNVATELRRMGVPESRLAVVHNAIEDYWFTKPPRKPAAEPHLVFLGRLGGDIFNLKLKGLARLVTIYRAFPQIPKTTVCMTTNRSLKEWLRVAFPRHYMYVNLRKDLIPGALAPLFGSLLILPSRYEGFSLSLAEGMSQGLVPVSYEVGIAPEIIKDGINGYLVSSKREAEARIRELLADDSKRLSMARRAQLTAQRFKSSRIADDLHDLYARVKSDRRKSARARNRAL